MRQAIPEKMRAVAADSFGSMDKLGLKTIPVPEVGPEEILVRVEAAGVGVWDSYEVEGEFAKMFGVEPKFPYVPGADGAGTVAAVGKRVKQFKEGDRVYAISEFNGKGFYAEYAVAKADEAAHIPSSLPTDQAGAMPVDAVTALRGLDDTLHLKEGESIMIFGASGGIGHLAVQLAKRMKARVFAIASGEDGVALVKSLGADAAVDGHKGNVVDAARKFAPQGFDAALLTAGGPAADRVLSAVREGGRVAYPHGVHPEPLARPGVEVSGYDGVPDPAALKKLNKLIEAGPFKVHIARSYPLEKATEAERALRGHYLGKMEVRPVM